MDWVAVIGALGGLSVTVGGALGVWWLRILAKRAELARLAAADARLAKKEEDTADRRRRKDTIAELYAILEEQRQSRAEDRDEVHGLRTQLQVLTARVAVCEADRARLAREVVVLAGALRQAGVPVPSLAGTVAGPEVVS